MKKLLLTLALIAFLEFSLQAQNDNTLQLTDIYNIENVTDPQISKDGNRIIYSRNSRDIMNDKSYSNLWMIDFNGENNRPLTTGNQRDFGARWSNDGKKIVYRSNKGGKVQLFIRWMDTGAEAQITNLPSTPGQPVWSPDDKYLAFTMFVPTPSKPFASMPPRPEGAKWNDPPKVITDLNYRSDGNFGFVRDGNSQIFVLPVDGGTPRQLTDSARNHNGLEWSGDGQHLYFSANLHEDNIFEPANSEIYSISLATKEIREITTRKGPDYSPKLSPDGSKIAYMGYDDQYLGYQQAEIYVMNADGSDPKLLTGDLDRDLSGLAWSGDGKSLFTSYSSEGKIHLTRVSMSGKTTDLADDVGGLSLGRPYTAGSFSVASNGRYAYTKANPYDASQLAAGEKGSSKQLTSINEDLFQYKTLGQVEEFWVESSYDQQKIQGWIVKPPNFDPSKKYPMILEIHGGPFAQYGLSFTAEIQLYAAAGYVVVYTNPRGSDGYGQDFGNLIHHNYPNQDYDDLMTCVDEVINRGYVDENKLYVTGGSGGGVLTAWIVGKTDRFNAAVVAKPVINWYSFVLYSDGPQFFYKYWFPGPPWDHLEHYMKRSPISLVKNVTTPTMLLTGEQDYRTPMAESEQYYAALKLNKVESALVRIPNASHGIAARPSNLVAKVAYILKWFEDHE